MLLLMDCGVFFMQNENLCVFSKINFLVEKGQVIQQHAPSFLSHHHHSSLVVVAFDLFYREKETQRRGRRGEKVERR